MIKGDKELIALFNRVNKKYFGGQLAIKEISYCRNQDLYRLRKCNTKIWAMCDEIAKKIYLSTDIKTYRHKFPRYVLEYLIYHESLHFFWNYHCRSFEKAEMKFPKYHQANIKLKKQGKLLLSG